MFTQIDNLPAGAIGFRAAGRITSQDRDTVLEPTIRTALGDNRQIRLLYVVEPDFAGYDSNAPFDNVVFGTQHFRDFEKIAFLAEDGPYSRAVGAMDGLIPASLKVFPTGDVEAAKAWLAE